MYFTSKSHEEKFNELMSNHSVRAHALSFIYLATSDALAEAKLVLVEDGVLKIKTSVNKSQLSSSQFKLAKLALNLFDSNKECDSIGSIIESLSKDNRKLVMQALTIRAGVAI